MNKLDNGQILAKVRNVDETNSDAIKEALLVFFQNLPKFVEVSSIQWLKELEVLIQRFPKYCMGHRQIIEKHIINFLDSNNYYEVIEAAKCAHALQQVRPSQEKAANSKTCWREQLERLCGAAQKLIGKLYPNALDNLASNIQNLNLTPPMMSPLSIFLNNIDKTDKSVSADMTAQILSWRLQNILIFIQAMLVEKYPVAKPIRPQNILYMIIRVVTWVTPNIDPASHIHKVRIQALRCLDALIFCLGSNLVPYSPLVIRLAMQALRNSKGDDEKDRKVRCQAYKSLSNWLNTLHCHKLDANKVNKGESVEDELINNIFMDITPHKHVVELTTSGVSTKKLSKKAKRKLANTMLQESVIASHIPGERNKSKSNIEEDEEVVISALECTELFLTVCGLFIKPENHKAIQDRLVRECMKISEHPSKRSLHLCQALEASRKCVPSGVAPPTHYCLDIYSQLVNCRDREISKYCSHALLDIRLHLHCSPPSLNFAVESIDRPTKQRPQNVVSEQNRQALEELLGSDRIPTKDIQNAEIITIPDEPAKKKSRTDVDQISVSSQSSIELSDDDSVEVMEVDAQVISNDSTADEPIIVTNNENVTNETVCNVDDTLYKNFSNIKEVVESTTKTNGAKLQEDIHEAKTQLVNISGDTIDGQESQHSVEVAYDYPNITQNNITELETIEGENIQCSNETDDVSIACGQVLRNSQELQRKDDEEVKVNGINENSNDKVVTESTITVKIAGQQEGVSVEDMMADFVDEVNDEVNVVDVDA